MTGVPAAQLMAEETAQIKEEERKKKAIEEYEEFLKTYYKSGPPPIYLKKKEDKSRNLQISEKKSQNLKKSETPKNNNDIEEVFDQDESEYMFKLHEGLVKIQAIIRGFLARKKFKVKL